MPDLARKLVLVAGGAGEVGEGIVRACLDAGARVVVPSRSAAKLEALRAALSSPGALVTRTADVGDADAASALRDWIAAEVGELDAVVASLGGWAQGAPLTGVGLAEWHRVLDMGLTAHFVCAKTFVPALAQRAGGSYTFVNGGGALAPVPGAGPVCVSAAAQLMLKDAFAKENAGVRINTLLLATPVLTRSRTVGRAGWISADDAGAYAAYLASDAAADTHGETIVLERPEQVPSG